MSRDSCLISAADLAPRLDAVRLLDARSGETGRKAYARSHLRGAVHADLDRDLAAAPGSSGGRHPLPEPDVWAERLGAWGIGPQTEVVVYDDLGGANAASRCWWMLRSAGHTLAYVLDGGLQAALEAGIDSESEAREPDPLPPYPVQGWHWPTADADEVDRRRRDPGWRLLDVRDETRFRGESEPFDPVAGHIPGARNLPYRLNLGPDGRFKPTAELGRLFHEALGTAPAEQAIVHCGSGVTACHTLLAMEVAGVSGASLYVGSWSDWCQGGGPVGSGDEADS